MPPMNSSKTRTLPPLNRVAPGELEQALLNWDEFEDASLVTLASHPQSAERLGMLRAAERWLTNEAGRTDVRADEGHSCPSADELFDYGRGPGCAPLATPGRESIEAHLATCTDCSGLVATLATPPPLPVEFSGEPELQQPHRRHTPARALRLSRTWVPFLLAAGLAGVVLLPPLLKQPGAQLPEHALLRGSDASELLFPRGTLLANGGAPQFELLAVENATQYRVEVFAHAGDAFDEGQRVQVLYSDNAQFDGETLAAGSYTWQAFARVDGLDQALGARDFEIVEAAQLVQEFNAALEPASSIADDERIALIRKLEQQGFRSDARRLAQLLPESAAKREFLRAPGR